MPSPFPGMDPYLESPSRWGGFHLSLLARIKTALNAVLPAHYVAEIDQYVWLEATDPEARAPDGKPDAYVTALRDGGDGAVALLEAPVYVALPRERHALRYVSISDREGDRDVTVVEVLSPANKGGSDREAYLSKRGNYLATDTNLVEYDLLRGGERLPLAAAQDDFPEYYVLVAQRGHTQAGLWPFGLRQPIPAVRVPLGPGDEPVSLDVGALLQFVYDESRYGSKIDYGRPPVPRLADDDAEWARQLLAHRGEGA